MAVHPVTNFVISQNPRIFSMIAYYVYILQLYWLLTISFTSVWLYYNIRSLVSITDVTRHGFYQWTRENANKHLLEIDRTQTKQIHLVYMHAHKRTDRLHRYRFHVTVAVTVTQIFTRRIHKIKTNLPLQIG